jgi:hypothetical protein
VGIELVKQIRMYLKIGVCIDPVRDNDRGKDFEGSGFGSVRATKAK